eukprot:3218049-Amphidinium_carterae.1
MSSRTLLAIVDIEQLPIPDSLSSLYTKFDLGSRLGLPVIGSMPIDDGPGAIVCSTGFCSSFSAIRYSGRTAIERSECLTVAKGLIVEPK